MTIVTAGGFTDPPVRPQLKIIGDKISRKAWKNSQQLSCGRSVNQVPFCCPSLLLSMNREQPHPCPSNYLPAFLCCNTIINSARLPREHLSGPPYDLPNLSLPSTVRLFLAISASTGTSRHVSPTFSTQTSAKGPMIVSSDMTSS